jgi:hypothetical protein
MDRRSRRASSIRMWRREGTTDFSFSECSVLVHQLLRVPGSVRTGSGSILEGVAGSRMDRHKSRRSDIPLMSSIYARRLADTNRGLVSAKLILVWKVGCLVPHPRTAEARLEVPWCLAGGRVVYHCLSWPSRESPFDIWHMDACRIESNKILLNKLAMSVASVLGPPCKHSLTHKHRWP